MKKIKVVVAKLGLDGHDRGARFISRYLMEAGMEVVYTGIRQTPETVCRIAIQEDADIIGVSILSGAHNSLIPTLIQKLRENHMDIPVIVGGIIPHQDWPFLQSSGVKAIFTPGASAKEIVNKIHEIVKS